ncbi:MAG: hypothetical protein EHM24_11075 [Acidobacteria bacterium]|nr:MAG: hypothetical protein EHM24_11075 [Acidobacteriota bacterium]
MTEAGIGRVLVASLHQAIADVLPNRLDFYENWLNPWGLLHGTIGLAPLNAVLSFLRLEGDVYQEVTQRAGRYAAEWTVASQAPTTRMAIRALPRPLRVRAVLRVARRTVRASYVGSRALVKQRQGEWRVDIRGSIFCGTRDSAPQPLCRFYAAALSRFLELYGLAGAARPRECRAMGDASCVMTLTLE